MAKSKGEGVGGQVSSEVAPYGMTVLDHLACAALAGYAARFPLPDSDTGAQSLMRRVYKLAQEGIRAREEAMRG